MKLHKYHGLGNDFLVLLDPDGRRPIDAKMARALCDRHRGAGADGLIRVTRAGEVADAEVIMELRNADGSRAETSGNGLRCLARAVLDAGMLPGPEMRVATDAGVRRIWISGDGLCVEMGEAEVVDAPSDVPGVIRSASVDIGNPHQVWAVEDRAALDSEDIGRRAAAISGSGTGAVNVELAWVGPGPDELTTRVWERGVGETQSCGSGASAAAAAAHSWGMVGRRVSVGQPGGSLEVDLSGPNVVLTGPATRVGTFEVEWPWP